MTKLEHILKILKNIEPDRNYADRSLSTIVNSPRNSKVSWFSFTFFRVAEYGAAVAMVGLLFFVMVGNSSLVKLFSPIQSGSLSSGGLRAEAEAIDIQIRLLDLTYEETSSTPETTTSIATLPIRKKATRQSAVIASSATGTIPEATSSPDITEVLNLLSE